MNESKMQDFAALLGFFLKDCEEEGLIRIFSTTSHKQFKEFIEDWAEANMDFMENKYGY